MQRAFWFVFAEWCIGVLGRDYRALYVPAEMMLFVAPRNVPWLRP